jgi:hypothetical protein
MSGAGAGAQDWGLGDLKGPASSSRDVSVEPSVRLPSSPRLGKPVSPHELGSVKGERTEADTKEEGEAVVGA